MSWVFLILAGLVEISFAVSLKLNEGFTRLGFSLMTAVSGIASFGLLSLALKHIPIGTAYAVWTGIGAVGTVIVGMIFFQEPRDLARIGFITLIVIGIVGLRFVSPG
jgi:quaternary ammonium compound-resistance protein SugE